jgi:hypothetical protein
MVSRKANNKPSPEARQITQGFDCRALLGSLSLERSGERRPTGAMDVCARQPTGIAFCVLTPPRRQLSTR